MSDIHTLSYRSLSNGKKYALIKGQDIGKGLFGIVGEVQGRQDFIYKEISLDIQNVKGFTASREVRIKSTYLELGMLKKLNLLEGYIREKDRLIIIMKKMTGQPGSHHIMNFVRNREFRNIDHLFTDAYVALLELNRKGVCHLDPHINNFLAENNIGNNRVTAIHWIDFGIAQHASYVSRFYQNLTYRTKIDTVINAFNSNKQTFQLLNLLPNAVEVIKKAKNIDRINHPYETALYASVVQLIGLALFCTPITSSFFAWQICRSYINYFATNEFRTFLEIQDTLYLQHLSVDPTEPRIYSKKYLQTWKATITLGYVLLNLYTLSNLYLSLPSLKYTPNLTTLFENLKTLDASSLTTLFENLKTLDASSLDKISGHINEFCIAPLATKILALKTVDMPLAEATYLYNHLKSSIDCFTSMLHHVLPTGHMLPQADLLYRYNPSLFFTYAKTKTKEAILGKTPEPVLINKNRPHSYNFA